MCPNISMIRESHRDNTNYHAVEILISLFVGVFQECEVSSFFSITPPPPSPPRTLSVSVNSVLIFFQMVIQDV